MPEQVRAVLTAIQRRWQLRSLLFAIAAAGAAYAASAVGGLSLIAAILVGAVVAIAILVRGSSLSLIEAALLVESRTRTLDNLIVTAADLDAHPRPVLPELLAAIKAQSEERIRSVEPRRVLPLWQPMIVAAVVIVGCMLLPRQLATLSTEATSATEANQAAVSFSVRISPPSYTRRRVEVFENPVAVTAIAGSRIHIENSAGTALRDLVATESTGIELEVTPNAPRKFLAINVVQDAAPVVRIATPGKDVAFATPSGQVAIEVHATDDLAVAQLSLRFTKASGGGENVTFTEGEVPLRIDRRGEQQWNGKATLALDSLGLADGDIVVYRAIARDSNPQGTPVQSDQYLIEIGKNSEIADAGFALPAEERKYAISQQMVIYKTERLIAERAKHASDWLEQTRGIGVEQRMVRAEVVFLGGGEVEDEVEEASRSDELTEGRLQNTGRAEMLRAINAMSRAEAQLNDGRAEEALVFEREALASLERALDRRRYFLRTLPDRSRIDATRRLTGDRRDARSWDRAATPAAAPGSLESQRRLMRDLAAGVAVDARLAARVAAIDPASADLQKAAVALASATNDEARHAAVRQAMATITNHALRTLSGSSAIDLPSDPLSGRLADELNARPRQ